MPMTVRHEGEKVQARGLNWIAMPRER
jgi:hypothetical protein